MAGQTYLSPRRYALSGPGIDTSGFTNAQLRQKLVAASALVDTWCNRPLIPTRMDLRGGAVVGEQHEWSVAGQDFASTLGQRRVYLNAGPVRSITGFAVQFTNSYRITLPPGNLYINNQDGYIEVIASQPTILGFPPLGWLFGLSRPVTTTDYTYGWQFAAEGDPCEADSPLLYYSSHGNWLTGGDVTVTVAGIEIDPGDYTINVDDGSILFAALVQPAVGEEVLASYTYVLPETIAQATAIVCTDSIGQARIASRGMLGLSSIRVAEVTLTQMTPQQMEARNGVSIPMTAAALLQPYALGSIG